MVTWYTCPGGRAFSVRPDLWGPGWEVVTTGGTAGIRRRYQFLADWTMTGRGLGPTPGASEPGVAEALVLGGQVLVECSRPWEDWTPDP